MPRLINYSEEYVYTQFRPRVRCKLWRLLCIHIPRSRYDLSTAGMYIKLCVCCYVYIFPGVGTSSRCRATRPACTCDQREIYQSPACIYESRKYIRTLLLGVRGTQSQACRRERTPARRRSACRALSVLPPSSRSF